jgi:hypothetical protein
MVHLVSADTGVLVEKDWLSLLRPQQRDARA